MKYLVVIFLATALALIEDNILGVMLIFAFISSVALQFEVRESLIIAFWSGIVTSVVHNSLLGRESLGLLFTVGLIQLYRQRVARHWIFMIAVVFLASVFYHLILARELLIKEIIMDGMLTFIFMGFSRLVRNKLFTDRIVVKI